MTAQARKNDRLLQKTQARTADSGHFREKSVEFTPDPGPTVSTSPATGVTATLATLNGTVNPNGANTMAYFEWGLTTNYDKSTQPVDQGSFNATLNVTASLTGLNPNTAYHYSCVASNSAGVIYGEDQTFTNNVVPVLGPIVLLPGGVIQISVTGSVGQSCIGQVSADLGAWTTVTNMTLVNGTGMFIDNGAPNFNRRFYRVGVQ